MRVKLVRPAGTLRLRLHDDLRVSSVRSGDGGNNWDVQQHHLA